MGSLSAMLVPATPTLLKLVGNPALTSSVIGALQSSGQYSILLPFADHPDEPAQAAVVHALSSYGPSADEQVPLLVRKLRSDSARIRRSAARGLKRHRESCTFVAGEAEALAAEKKEVRELARARPISPLSLIHI